MRPVQTLTKSSRAALVAGAVFALVTLVTSPASAGSPKAEDVVIKQEPGVVTVKIPNPGSKTKQLRAPNGSGDVGILSNCSVLSGDSCNFTINAGNSRWVTPPGGVNGELRSGGSVYVDIYKVVGCCLTQVDYYNTSSYSQWGGQSPWNATSIKHTDVWDADFVGVGFSFGGTPSGSINWGSGRLEYSNTVSNTWRVDHSVQHVYIDPAGAVTGAFYEVHGSYQFGSNFYTTDGYGGVGF